MKWIDYQVEVGLLTYREYKNKHKVYKNGRQYRILNIKRNLEKRKVD